MNEPIKLNFFNKAEGSKSILYSLTAIFSHSKKVIDF